ncbi:MAG: MarR family transcriptional regulator [Acidobacteriota bacterium]|nr:MarR family transcriptional regulator [Acidobacteriota bacterium]
MLKASTQASSFDLTAESTVIDRIQASLKLVAQSGNQVRVHEELLRVAGVRIDRAGLALLYKLGRHDDLPCRVTSLAGMLGVDTPTVTRKVQQLEREGYVVREPDPEDRRASLISLTESGQNALARVLSAHRERLARLFKDWDEADVQNFATLLERFAESLHTDTEDNYGD